MPNTRAKNWFVGGARVAGLGLAVLASAAPDAHAEVMTGPCAAVWDPNDVPSTDPRMDHLVVDGVKVNVLVPPRYRFGHRRYPTVYLFHGAFSDEDSFSSQTDLLAFTSGLDEDDQAIAVIPDGGHLPAGLDWVDGTHHQESFVVDTLIPFIDAHYRSLGDRSHRAAAGFSAGGLDAMVFAARHPDLFVAAASVSGFVDPFAPVGIQIAPQFADFDNQLCGGSVNWLGIWGDPVIHPMGWLGHDPTDLAPSLGDVSLYISSGNGVTCPGDAALDPFLGYLETLANQLNQNFDQALTAAGVYHTTNFRDCGVHLFSNVNIDFPRFWPQMVAAFGRPAPREFDYRTGDVVASVWGWEFRADPARAPEFLDVRRASIHGLQIAGSGQQGVATAPLFRRHQWVNVEGAGPIRERVRADDAGRLVFTVDLGAPHSLEQGTDAQLAAAASDPNYFASRTIRFWPIDRDDGED